MQEEMMTDDETRLRNALVAINQEISWWFSCAGQVSRDDVVSMFRGVKAQIEGVRDLVWPDESDETTAQSAPLDNDF